MVTVDPFEWISLVCVGIIGLFSKRKTLVNLLMPEGKLENTASTVQEVGQGLLVFVAFQGNWMIFAEVDGDVKRFQT